jgi:1,2-dihydroxy-3-keto-5-methylthiopentene dioxygenase
MATLKVNNGEIIPNESEIFEILAPLQIQLKQYDLKESSLYSGLLAQDVLSYLEKDHISQLNQEEFDLIKQQGDYFCYDLFVLHPGAPTLYTHTKTYSRYHTHVDAEALYVLSGEAIFGFILPDGNQVQLLLKAHDFIHIPSRCEHWFSPTASLNIKAVRYFSSARGWMPEYTDTEVEIS